MKRITSLIVCALGLLLTGLTGCASTQTTAGMTPCDQVRAAYNAAQATVDNATQSVVSTQAALDALPANDPIRTALEPTLTKAVAYARETQVAASLAKVLVATLCPQLPQTPTTPAPVLPVPSTQLSN